MRIKTLFSLLLLVHFNPAFGQAVEARAGSHNVRGDRPAHIKRHTAGRGGRPLWDGSQYTNADRRRAIYRGLQYISRMARDPINFPAYGHDFLWFFYTFSRTAESAAWRRLASRTGTALAHDWRRNHRRVRADAYPGAVMELALGSDAADGFDVHDELLKGQIRRAANRFTVADFLGFDPRHEPPPDDIPKECSYCGAYNARGDHKCLTCGRPLSMKSPYDVWRDALIITYKGDRFGVTLGTHYGDVFKWASSMRPYEVKAGGDWSDFAARVYAVTHLVFTANDYGSYRLPRSRLSEEYHFLKQAYLVALGAKDVDMLGEIIDSLKAFGLAGDDPSIRSGIEFLLSQQNADGGWGRPDESDVYYRYHTTWNAVAALNDYRIRSERLSFRN